MNKLKPVLELLKTNKKFVIVLSVLGFGVFLLIALRGGSEVKLGPIDVTLPSFKNEAGTDNQLDILPSFLQTSNTDDIDSTNPDIVITEDTSDPEEYKRNGLEGSGEIVYIQQDLTEQKIIDEINAAKFSTKSPEIFILNQTVSNQEATTEKTKLKNRIPVYIANFSTSNKKELNINIYSSLDDAEDILRVEIMGVNYQNNSVSETNPDMIAFREGFNRAKSELQSMGVDIKKLHIKFGFRSIVTKTATNWVVKLGLLN